MRAEEIADALPRNIDVTEQLQFLVEVLFFWC
jgi:hypothetical protein